MKHSFYSTGSPAFLILLIIVAGFINCTTSADNVTADNLNTEPLYQADPTIFFHEGIYYLYGTNGGDPHEGFKVYTSSDMQLWEGPEGVNEGYALRKEDAFGDRGFWAPQVFYYNDRFYMAYTANENIAIAESDNPLGPFIQKTKKALPAPVKQIDPFIFIDEDGKKYVYHVRLTKGNRIFVAELKDDFTGIKDETLQEAISAEEDWENTADANWPVAEGPSILKHNNLYYLVYSANDFRNPDYAVGYAVSDNPLGPWEKYSGNPILNREDLGENGTGHGDFFKDDTGNLFYVFHTHNSENQVAPRKTAIVKAGFSDPEEDSMDKKDVLAIDENSFYFIQAQE